MRIAAAEERIEEIRGMSQHRPIVASGPLGYPLHAPSSNPWLNGPRPRELSTNRGIATEQRLPFVFGRARRIRRLSLTVVHNSRAGNAIVEPQHPDPAVFQYMVQSCMVAS